MTKEQGRAIDALRRECPKLAITYEETARGWQLWGWQGNQMLINVKGRALGHVRSEFLSAYAQLIIGGLIAA